MHRWFTRLAGVAGSRLAPQAFVGRLSIQGIALAAIGVVLTGYASGAQASMIGPILPYFGLGQSPFNGLPFSYFHLETFEEGSLTAPGVKASAGSVIGPAGAVDSVEGPGALGHSFFASQGAAGITFTFDAAVLGHLPTHAGIVWTDGDGTRTFEAFDVNNTLIGTLTDSTQKFFSTGGDGDPSNYRFFGATDPAGISSIFISNALGGIEVDDLQYGFLSSIPEPDTLTLTVVPMGILVIGAVLSRRPWRGGRSRIS